VAKIGEFELLVLLAILRQSESPYANRVRDDLGITGYIGAGVAHDFVDVLGVKPLFGRTFSVLEGSRKSRSGAP